MEAKESFFILGASGLVGGCLFNHLTKQGHRVIGTYNQTKVEGLVYFDVTCSCLEKLGIAKFKYGVICSAMTKIDECKKHPEKSRRINVGGLERIVKEFKQFGIVPVFLSSAAVFGEGGGKKEDDEREPLNLYGEQKKEVEDFIVENVEKYLIIRLGKVVGIEKGDGFFGDWLTKYKNREEILCVDNEKLSVASVEDIAKAISILMEKDLRGIFHINPLECHNRFELATDFFNYLGIKDAKIKRCSIENFNFLERRTKKPYLDASKFLNQTGFKFSPLEKLYDRIILKNS